MLVLSATLWWVLAKWGDLSLPFFWDELGVYGPGVLYMVDHGIGLMPSDLPPELSRGHPLFFYALHATMSQLLGFSLLKLHLVAVLISFWVMGSTWWMTRKLFGEWPAALAALCLLATPAIFAQAHLLLPEMLLAGLILWALYGFHRQSWAMYLTFASLAVLTKESALVLPLACALFAALPPERYTLRRSVLALSPLLVFAGFLVLQRWQNGWFFFPFHTQFISFSLAEVIVKAETFADFLFWHQGRWALLVGLLLAALWWALRPEGIQWGLISPWFRLTGIFFFGIGGFTLFNFYMDRYLLMLFPLFAMGIGAALVTVPLRFPGWQRFIPRWILWAIPTVYLMHQEGKEFRHDVDISYRQILQVQKEACHYLSAHAMKGDTIYANFPLYSALQDPRFGFVETEIPFHATVIPSAKVRFVANIHPGVPWGGAPLDPSTLIWQYEIGISHCEIYQGQP